MQGIDIGTDEEEMTRPGMAIQKMTTSEPDDGMIEVAIQAVEAVFDWRAYERDNFHTS